MKTTATNRKIRVLLTAIRDKQIVPRPEFQRRLVWSNKHKLAFLDTVLRGLPFPEIYIAAGEVDPDTAEGKEMLVDGQQRITTLYQYFHADEDLRLDNTIPPYGTLTPDQKKEFLEYDVVVRDLGSVSISDIKEVFRRINSTRYALNSMELDNARYDGEFKRFGDELSQNEFFEQHRVFSAHDVKRMQDVRFALTLTATVMSAYFDRDSEIESFLIRFNDEFPERKELGQQFDQLFELLNKCKFDATARIWQKADLFTAIVELYVVTYRTKELILTNVETVSRRMKEFYAAVDLARENARVGKQVREYYHATIQASNDRSSRIARGESLRWALTDPRAEQKLREPNQD